MWIVSCQSAKGGVRCAGNINQLVLKAESYLPALQKTHGIIGEFVNPKYKDDTRTSFKSSTRLECMMQDFPHGLPSESSVGFTVINQVQHCSQAQMMGPEGAVVECGTVPAGREQ
jgi:hypothetical protein